jgi:hypothetical protein
MRQIWKRARLTLMNIGLEITSFDDAENLTSIAKSCNYDFGVSQILKMDTQILLKIPAAFPESALIIQNAGLHWL